VHDPVNTPAPSDEPHPAWLLTPTDLAAISADPALLHRLAAGEQPDESNPVGGLLAAWLREVANGGNR
jgi:hypothetical protein